MIVEDDLTISHNIRDVGFASSCRSGGGTTIIRIKTFLWTATRQTDDVGLLRLETGMDVEN